MTTAALDPTAAIAEAGQELLDALRDLVSLGNRPELLDDVSKLLTRARRKVNRAKHAAEEAAPPRPTAPAQPASPAPSWPAPSPSAPRVAMPASTPPRVRPVTVPIPRATPRGHYVVPRGVPMSQPPPYQPQSWQYPQQPTWPQQHRQARRRNWPKIIAMSSVLTLLLIVFLIIVNNPTTGAEIACEGFVEKRLKAPASAEYSGTTTRAHATDADTYIVTGSVDSQNGFGAMIRNRYSCTVRDEGSSWRLVDLTFTGR